MNNSYPNPKLDLDFVLMTFVTSCGAEKVKVKIVVVHNKTRKPASGCLFPGFSDLDTSPVGLLPVSGLLPPSPGTFLLLSSSDSTVLAIVLTTALFTVTSAQDIQVILAGLTSTVAGMMPTPAPIMTAIIISSSSNIIIIIIIISTITIIIIIIIIFIIIIIQTANFNWKVRMPETCRSQQGRQASKK